MVSSPTTGSSSCACWTHDHHDDPAGDVLDDTQHCAAAAKLPHMRRCGLRYSLLMPAEQGRGLAVDTDSMRLNAALMRNHAEDMVSRQDTARSSVDSAQWGLVGTSSAATRDKVTVWARLSSGFHDDISALSTALTSAAEEFERTAAQGAAAVRAVPIRNDPSIDL